MSYNSNTVKCISYAVIKFYKLEAQKKNLNIKLSYVKANTLKNKSINNLNKSVFSCLKKNFHI